MTTALAEDSRQKVVWVVNEGGHNYDPARKFGRLMPLTTGNINHFNLDRLMVTLAPRLKSAEQEDYLLISGTPILNALVVAMWLTRFPRANLLQWSAMKMDYVPIHLHVDSIERMLTPDAERAAS
jgi:hypothetical protein